MSGRRLAIVGAGRMGEAVLRGVLGAGLWAPEDVVCTARRPERIRELIDRYGVAATTDNRDAVRDAAVVVLGVKPAQVAEVVGSIAGGLDGALVISVAAGVRTRSIEEVAGAIAVVRAMPNTPLLVGRGMTALAAGSHADAADLAVAERLFGAVGRVAVVDEELIDAVTAVSGSGPAYLFLFAEALVDAAVAEGLPAELAGTLVRQTLLGASTMLDDEGDPVALRALVTSPGGTTEAAVAAFESHGLRAAVAAAVAAAHHRARELGGDDLADGRRQ
jgi:pyrroline-5-carboxylate reductase